MFVGSDKKCVTCGLDVGPISTNQRPVFPIFPVRFQIPSTLNPWEFRNCPDLSKPAAAGHPLHVLRRPPQSRVHATSAATTTPHRCTTHTRSHQRDAISSSRSPPPPPLDVSQIVADRGAVFLFFEAIGDSTSRSA